MTSLRICCSLTKDSRTNLPAHALKNAYAAAGRATKGRANPGRAVSLVELSDYKLPLCNGRACYQKTTDAEWPGAVLQTLSDW